MSNTDTNDEAIKKKKNNSAKDPNIGGFIKNYGIGTLGVVVFVIFGAIGLYMTKVAMANVLPTDVRFEPYTCSPNVNQDTIDVPMNKVRELGLKGLALWQIWDDSTKSWEQNAQFNKEDTIKSFKDSWIKSLRNASNAIGASGLTKFTSSVMNDTSATSFGAIQSTFSLFGSWNETLFIVFFGFFGFFLLPFFWIFNFIQSVMYHFTNLFQNNIFGGWFSYQTFKEKYGEDWEIDGTPFSWQGENSVEIRQVLWKWFSFLFLLVPGSFILLFISMFIIFPFYLTFMPIIKTLMAKYTLGTNKEPLDESSKPTDKKSLLSFIKDTFAYKRTFLLFLSILNLFTCANTWLGEQYFGAVIIAIILAIVFCDIFAVTEPDDNTMILKTANEGLVEDPTDSKDKAKEKEECMFQAEIDAYDARLNNSKDGLNSKTDAVIKQFNSLPVKDPNLVTLVDKLKKEKKDIKLRLIRVSKLTNKDKIDLFQTDIDEYANLITSVETEIAATKDRLEAERLEAEKMEAARLEVERLEAEKLAAEKLETDKLATDKLETDKLAADINKKVDEKLEAARLEADINKKVDEKLALYKLGADAKGLASTDKIVGKEGLETGLEAEEKSDIDLDKIYQNTDTAVKSTENPLFRKKVTELDRQLAAERQQSILDKINTTDITSGNKPINNNITTKKVADFIEKREATSPEDINPIQQTDSNIETTSNNLLTGPATPEEEAELAALTKSEEKEETKEEPILTKEEADNRKLNTPVKETQLIASEMMDDAIKYNNETMINTYMQSDYDMNYKDKDGLTPLEFAVTNTYPRTVATLLKSPNLSRETINAAAEAATKIADAPMRQQIISLLKPAIKSKNEESISDESISDESNNDESIPEESKNDESISEESKNEESKNDETDSDDEDDFEETPSYTKAINQRNASRTLKNTNLKGGSKNSNKTLKRRRFNIRLV